MPKIKDNIIRVFNRIFRRNSFPMLANVSKQNYDEYHTTYDTLSKIFGELDDIEAYLVGGISSAIQTNQDLYRKNSDIGYIYENCVPCCSKCNFVKNNTPYDKFLIYIRRLYETTKNYKISK